MAPKAKSLRADALNDAVTKMDESVLVDGAATNAPAADERIIDSTSAESDPAVVDAAPVWPRMVTLCNNSGVQLVEPVSGKFLFAFGSETVELLSQEHEQAITDNLRALASVNRLGEALTIDGLPV